MANTQLFIAIASILLLPLVLQSTSANPTHAAEKKIVVVVEGMVYCQSCEHSGSSSLSAAEPIPSAKISVICKNHKDQVSFYKVFQTNRNGYFFAELEGFKMTHYLLDHPLHSCNVKLVSSALENCSLLSNVNNGLYGAPLRYENKRLKKTNYEAVIYTVNPLAFRPNECPATTH